MLPQLKYNQKAYFKITNLEHGGPGWELSTCLWSPVYNKGKHKTKSWKDCNVKEATDPYNGLLLIPNLDKLFDKRLITFENTGKILISSQPINKRPTNTWHQRKHADT